MESLPRARFHCLSLQGLNFLLPFEPGSGKGHDTTQINRDHADGEHQDTLDPGGAREQGQPEPKPEDKQADTKKADEEVHQGFHGPTSNVTTGESRTLHPRVTGDKVGIPLGGGRHRSIRSAKSFKNTARH